MSESGNWLSHGFKKAPSFLEAQSALGWGILLALFTLVAVAYLLQGSQAVVSGYHIQQDTSELKIQQEKNTLLEAEISAAQPVSELKNRAIYLGFVNASSENIEYITIYDYPTTTGIGFDSLKDPASHEVVSNNWWRRMSRGFNGWRRATCDSSCANDGSDFLDGN